MVRGIIGGASMGAALAAAAAMGMGGQELLNLRPVRPPHRPEPRFLEASRKQRRQADRSKKQYLLKGIRP